MTTMHLRQFIVPSDPSEYRPVFDALLEGQQVPLFECTYRRKDGSQFQGEVSVSLVRDDSGQPQYVQTIKRDITWRNAAERALRESEERYRIISESISDYAYAFRIEPDGTLVSEWITDSFMRMTGYSPEEIDSKGQYALYYPGEETRVAADLAQALAGEAVSGEYRIVTKSGETRWVNIHRKPVWDEAHSHVVRLIGVAQDITKRKESEENLRRSEEQYRLIAENATDMISRVTTDDERIYVSPSCRALLGYEPEELIGPNSSTLIHPDDVADMETAWSAIEQTNAPVTFTCRMLHKNGEYRWFEVTGKSILTDTGEVKEYIALSRDISARLQMEAILKEQDRLRYELQSEQQLSDIKSSLMRTISHEFRTPLALILTSTDFLDTYFDRLDAQKRKDRLQSIRVQIKRLSDMLDDISFVVQGTLHHMTAHPSPMNLEEYTRSIVEEIETSIGRNHHFAFTTDGTLTQGVADKALVLRILTNLLSNAIKYSPENSIIAVDLRRRGGDAVLEVSDQGIGISAEEQKRIFEPFYRSASVIDTVGGTGLGLSIVKDCVLLHGGSISVRSALNRGTTFTVQLPQSNT
jgi:PAS domain S-box-containing protein